jgi:hypothetical protein
MTTWAFISGIMKVFSVTPKYPRWSSFWGTESVNSGNTPPTAGGWDSALEKPAHRRKIPIKTTKYLKIAPILYIDYRNTPLTVKVGFTPFLLQEYACKDIAIVLIGNALNRFLGFNESPWFLIIKKIEPGPKTFQS